MIAIGKCTAFVTVQDLGWPVGRAIGLPLSGALDRASLRLANALVGNADGLAGLEVALGGLRVDFEEPGWIATAGATGVVELDGRPVPLATTAPVGAGSRLTIGPVTSGRFVYLAIAGGIDVPAVLGARATYLPTGLGGWQGRRLVAGDRLPVGRRPDRAPVDGHAAPVEDQADRAIRVVAGPQLNRFGPDERRRLETEVFTVLPASDRMGTRLNGPPLAPTVAATHPSEATCLGAMQVPDGGQPIVLLADGPTVGGYPKIAAVIGADLDRFAQLALGASVRFQWVPLGEAERARADRRARLEQQLTAIRNGYQAR